MSASKVKQTLSGLMNLAGWYAYRQRKMLRSNALILMYHRVLPGIGASPVPVQAGMYVTPESLRLQLTYLKKKFKIISLQNLVRRLNAGRNIARCCVVTFDDGWQDNYQYAFPILREFNLPATIFLSTEFIGTDKWFWPEELAWCISHVEKNNRVPLFLDTLLDIMLNGKNMEHVGADDKVDRIVEIVKQWDTTRREKLVRECTRYRQSICQGGRLLLSWSEVKEMNDSGLVSFGSHTVSHALLDQIHGQELQLELTASRECLEKHIGQPVDLLAYPNGNYSQEVIEALPGCGYLAAVTTERGFVGEGVPLLQLPRVAVHEDVSRTLDLFKWRLFVR